VYTVLPIVFSKQQYKPKTFVMASFTKKAALVILSVAVIAGCKKDDNKDNGNSKTQMIASGSWKMTSDYIDPAEDVNGDGVPEHEILPFLETCEKDNLFSFTTDGTFTADEGASKCDPSDPQTQSTKWKFINNESLLVVGEANSADTVSIVELSAATLKLRSSLTLLGVTYSETVTYGH
jgi:hypothetical protein